MLKKISLFLVALLLLFGAWFYSFRLGGSPSREALPEALAALNSNDAVQVMEGKWQTFTPPNSPPSTGLIFYPGGRVDAGSYAPAQAAIAAAGYLVVNVPMPFDLARYGWKQAEEVIAAYPEIETWVIGGHSLGGRMAARFVDQYPGQIDGLILWSAYPSFSDDLSELALPVLTVYGSLEGGVWRIERSASLLPADARWVKIEGGNHNQFGYYVTEPGDRLATISQADQQAQIMAATLAFLGEFEDRGKP